MIWLNIFLEIHAFELVMYILENKGRLTSYWEIHTPQLQLRINAMIAYCRSDILRFPYDANCLGHPMDEATPL